MPSSNICLKLHSSTNLVFSRRVPTLETYAHWNGEGETGYRTSAVPLSVFFTHRMRKLKTSLPEMKHGYTALFSPFIASSE